MLNDGTTTAYKQSLTKQIIAIATTAFLSNGIKAVKMDDIANKLSISKRTLYELFATKEQLLLECVKNLHNDFNVHMDKYVKADTSVMAIIIETYRYQMDRLNIISPAYYYDLPKYPSVVKWMEGERKRNEGKALEFYKKGIDEGYFRKDVDFTLINKVSVATIDYIMENQFFKHYTMQEIFHNIILLYVRGFCTLKGVKALEEYNL